MPNRIVESFQRLPSRSRAALAVGVAFLALGAVEAVRSHAGSGTSAPLCRTVQLSAHLARLGVAAGSVGADAVLRNESSAACSLQGYPALQMLDRKGRPLPTRVRRGASATVRSVPVRRVVLAPGGAARFHLGFADMTGYGRARCPVSARVAVTPPGTRSAIAVPWHLQPYGGTAEHVRCGVVHVSAVFAPATGR